MILNALKVKKKYIVLKVNKLSPGGFEKVMWTNYSDKIVWKIIALRVFIHQILIECLLFARC